jgi:hypothetical protein
VVTHELVVHLTGGENTALVAGIAALGAIAGAGIGASFSYFMQRSKIRADGSQLERQFQHEREMKEREALRDALDFALEAARAGISNCQKAIRDAEYGTPPAIDAVGLAGSRLVIRLGRGHPLERSYQRILDQLNAIYPKIGTPLGSDNVGLRAAACNQLVMNAKAAVVQFGTEAALLVGSPLAVANRSSEVHDYTPPAVTYATPPGP